LRLLCVLILLLCLHSAAAQGPATAASKNGGASATDSSALLSPQAAYDQAGAPIDITRRNKANWSEIEKAALAVAVDQAKTACLTRNSIPYTGDDLISYARLCDLGQQWKIVFTAAMNYITSKDEAKPQLEQAYAFEVVADLNMEQWSAAGSTCFAMMRSVPYGPLSDEVTTATIRYLQFAYLGNALDVSAQRQPHLLDLIRGNGAAAADVPSGQADAKRTPTAEPVPLHTLVRHALDFAALQAYNKQPEEAAAAVADIEKALPQKVPPDEAILIAADMKQYGLIGTRFPELPGAVSLMSSTASPRVNLGSVTIFMLFPPWCAQCIRQEHEMAPALFQNGENNVHLYGLLADKPPPPMRAAAHAVASEGHRAAGAGAAHPGESSEKVDSSQTAETPKSAAQLLRGTPTLVVDPSTLAEFNANDFPFLIATDHDGIIRLMVSAAPDNALVKDGPVDQIVDTILAGWPPPASAQAAPKPAGAPLPAKQPDAPR
jgi:hypothetical protein